MNSWQRTNQFLLVISRAFGATVRIRTWSPFLLYALAQALVMFILYLGVRPPLNAFFYALPDRLVPPEYFSYPLHLLLIPSLLYNQAILPLGLFMESLLQAAATWIFVRYALSGQVPGLRSALAEVRFGYWQFVVIWLLNYALLRGSTALFGLAFDDLWVGFARRRMVLELAHYALGAVFNSLLAYTTIVIILERTSLRSTIRLALGAFRRHWFATFVTVFAGTLLTVPFARVLESAPTWIGRFNPEVILGVTGVSLIAGAIASYLVSAVLSFWYLTHRPGA